jgi:tetratricopeptide (TPR) repeat protein
MSFSVTVIAATLLNAAASAVLIAGRHNLDNCGMSDSGDKGAVCTGVIRGGGEITQNQAFADNIRSTAYDPEGDRGSIIPDIIRLDPKDLDAPRNRDVKDQAKSDLNQIIVYYNAAIKHDPKDDDAYFHRGLAKFYAGALPQAVADLSQASKLDPQYPYYALWIDIIDKRGNMASSLPQAISKINMAKWPAPVIRLFLGQTTPAAVLAAAGDPDANTKRGQVCEANFYSGELALQQGAKDEATRLFRLAAAGCARDFVEGSAAGAELHALGENP